MLEAGFSKKRLRVSPKPPLAGYLRFHGERTALTERDPLFVRALALKDSGRTCVLLIYDLLVITEELAQGLGERLEIRGLSLMVAATHTHSAPGGYWDTLPARLAMGHPRQGFLETLIEDGEQAARAALADLAPARFSCYEDHVAELARNRRDAAGPTDDQLFGLYIKRESDERDALLVGFAAHPVIVAERQPQAISADFPGELIKRLEENVSFAAFINGGLGGADVVFPDEAISCAANLAMMAEPLRQKALETMGQPCRPHSLLAERRRDMPLPKSPKVRIAFGNQPLLDLALSPLQGALNLAFRKAAPQSARLQAFAIGEALILGVPADCGLSLALAIKDYAKSQGFRYPFVASQCNGYIGYVHRRKDYEKVPSKATRAMAYYENAMGIFGTEQGEALFDEARRLIDDLRFTRENRP